MATTTAVLFDHYGESYTFDSSGLSKVGVRFSLAQNCYVRAIRFYNAKSANYSVGLWRVSDGALIASGGPQAMGSAGWKEIDVPDTWIYANTEYVVGAWSDGGWDAFYGYDGAIAGTHTHGSNSVTGTVTAYQYHYNDNADGSYPSTIGGSWEPRVGFVAATNDAPSTPGVFTSPVSGTVFSGTHTVSWGASSDPEGNSFTYDVDITADGGATWTRIADNLGSNSFQHDFSGYAATANGAQLRTWATDSLGAASGTRYSAWFSINRVPGAPTVTAPNGGEEWYGEPQTITWTAASDSDGQALTYDVELSSDGGASWKRLASGVSGTSYSHDFVNEAASTASRIRVRASDGIQAGAWDASDANFTVVHNKAPYAPALVEPPNSSTADLASGYGFQFTYKDPDPDDSMASYAFRRKVSGAASYEYWNAGTAAWQSTEVFNALTLAKDETGTVTFASGKWTNDTTYQWSVAARDNGGLTGPYADDFTVTAGTGPTATVNDPTGTVADTSRPVVRWTYSDAENNPQNTYRVKVFTEAVYSDAAFDPDTSTATWDSGLTTSSTDRDAQVGVDLVDGTTYRAYVQVSDATLSSPWAWSAFTLELDEPNAPTLEVDYLTDSNRVRLKVTGNDVGPTYDVTNTTFRVEYSDDGGSTWAVVRNGAALKPDSGTRIAYLFDYEAPVGLARSYRAITEGEV